MLSDTVESIPILIEENMISVVASSVNKKIKIITVKFVY